MGGPANMGLPWSEAESERAKAMLREGFTPKQIAAELGRPAGAVRSRFTREGVMLRPRWTAEQDAVIRANPSLTGAQLVPLVAACGPERCARTIVSRRQRLGVVVVPLTESHARALRSARSARAARTAAVTKLTKAEGRDARLVALCRQAGGFPVRVLVNGAPVEIYPARAA